MKIINGNVAYIQEKDILAMLYFSSDLDTDMFCKIVNNNFDVKNTSSFIKVTDPDAIEYLSNENVILDYYKYFQKSIFELKKIFFDISLNQYESDSYSYDDYYDDDATQYLENKKRKNYNEYLLSQIREIIRLKLHLSEIDYPLIENKLCEIGNNDESISYQSVDLNKVIVVNEKGSINDNDYMLADYSYRLLFNIIDEMDIEFELSSDENKLVAYEKNLNSKKTIKL